jgi:outer membrane protein, multidrug efflux system
MLLATVACAPLPADLPQRPEMVSPRAETVAMPNAGSKQIDWLSAPWWRAFGDETLDGLMARALTGNPSLLAAKSRIDAAQRMERLAQINAGVNAQASVSAERSRLTANGIFPPPIGGSRYTQEDASTAVTYAFDWWGRNRALITAATGDAAAASAEADAARLAVSALVADAYFTLADATARAAMACESAEQRRQALRLLNVRLARGLDAADRVRHAESALAQDNDQCLLLDYQARAARYRLAALLGEGPDAATTLPLANLDDPLPLPTALPLDWLAARPDVAAQRHRAEAEAARNDAVRAEFYPNIDLTLLAGLQSIEFAKWLERGSFNGSFGAAIHIPLFNTRTLQAKLGLAEAAYAAAVADYNRTVLDATRQAADNYALSVSLAQRVTLLGDALASAERAASLAETRKQRGLSSQLELLDNRIAVLAIRQADVQLRAARLRATVALAQALGGDTHSIPR